MTLRTETAKETRYYVRDPFNPASPTQILDYMRLRGYSGGHNPKAKTDTPSTDEQTLRRLSKKDPFFAHILAWRSLSKLDSTYATGLLARADDCSRIHSRFGHKPSTWRLSSADPNLQNLPTADDEEILAQITASEIRRAVVAAPDCLLVSADFAAIEAVVTGWFAGDPDFMRLARYGIHSYLLSHKLGRPADLSWSDADLSSYLAEIKREHHDSLLYRSLKRVVHGTDYGETAFGLHKMHPHLFPQLADAEAQQALYFELCPKLRVWQAAVRARADKQCYLGGDDHPYRFKHWFWEVTTWDPRQKRVVSGSDWNRCVAFYPQSTTAGIQFDTALILQDPASPHYSGDLYHGSTPLRALVHDEFLAEVPKEHVDRYVANLQAAMSVPMPHLRIGHDILVGPNWAQMEPYS